MVDGTRSRSVGARLHQEENLVRFATTDQKLDKIDQKLDAKFEWLAAIFRSTLHVDKTPSPPTEVQTTPAPASGNRSDGVLGAVRSTDRFPETRRATPQSNSAQETSNRGSHQGGEILGKESLNSSQELDVHKVFDEFHAQLDGPQVQVVFQQASTEKLTDLEMDSVAHKVFDELPNSVSDFGVSSNLGVSSTTIQKSFEKPVLETSPKALKLEINPTTTDRSFSIDYELNGKLPSLSLEIPMFGDFIWARQDEKYSRNCGIFDAHHMFEKISVRRLVCSDYSAQVGSGQLQLGNWVFDPGDFVDSKRTSFAVDFENDFRVEETGTDSSKVMVSQDEDLSSVINVILNKNRLWTVNLVFDPGISVIPDNEISGKMTDVFASFNGDTMEGKPQIMPFDRGKTWALHSLVVDDVGDMQLVEFRDLSVDLGNVQKVCNCIFTFYATGLALIANEAYDFVELLTMFGDFFKSIDRTSSFTFDPGGVLVLKITMLALDCRGYAATVEPRIVEQRLQWDPGGIVTWRSIHGTGFRGNKCYLIDPQTMTEIAHSFGSTLLIFQ